MWRLIFLFTLPLSAQIFLATPRRCGTHWLIYSLEHLTRHRWIVAGGREWNWFEDLESDPQLERYTHSHTLFQESASDADGNHLILLIRNYREALLREYGTIEAIQEAVHAGTTTYFQNLELFERWDPSSRLLVTYEELLSSPKESFEQILSFLGESDERLDGYLNALPFHKKRLLRYYRRCGGSHSQGEDFLYHTKKYSSKQWEALDRQINSHYPLLWDTYLIHYSKTLSQ